MFDKSIPKFSVIMKCNKEKVYTYDEVKLPQGFKYKKYEIGDIDKWASIEVSVGEFSATEDAIDRFNREFIPFGDELYDRCYFIVDDNDNYIATASALYYNAEDTHKATINWVAVKPEFQGLGFGKAIIQKVLSLYKFYEPNQDIYLKTQTWSHRAIKIYLNLGFHVLKNETLAHYQNEYKNAIEVLQKVMDVDTFNLLIDAAE